MFYRKNNFSYIYIQSLYVYIFHFNLCKIMTTVALSENLYGDLKVFNFNDVASRAAFNNYVHYTNLDAIVYHVATNANYLYVDEEEYGGHYSEHILLKEAIEKGQDSNKSYIIYDRNGTVVMNNNYNNNNNNNL